MVWLFVFVLFCFTDAWAALPVLMKKSDSPSTCSQQTLTANCSSAKGGTSRAPPPVLAILIEDAIFLFNHS